MTLKTHLEIHIAHLEVLADLAWQDAREAMWRDDFESSAVHTANSDKFERELETCRARLVAIEAEELRTLNKALADNVEACYWEWLETRLLAAGRH